MEARSRDSEGEYVEYPLWAFIDPKTVIALLVVGGLMAGWVFQKWLGIGDVPDWLKVTVGTIVGFYFRDKRTSH